MNAMRIMAIHHIYENMAKKANIQDPFEIIKKKIDTIGKEMLFTVMEFMNQKTVLHLSTLWLSRASLITRLVCEQKIA